MLRRPHRLRLRRLGDDSDLRRVEEAVGAASCRSHRLTAAHRIGPEGKLIFSCKMTAKKAARQACFVLRQRAL